MKGLVSGTRSSGGDGPNSSGDGSGSPPPRGPFVNGPTHGPGNPGGPGSPGSPAAPG